MRQRQIKSVGVALAAGMAGGGLSQWIGQTIGLRDHSFWSAWLGGDNFTGQSVSQRTALQLSTVWACVRLIAETLATLPLDVKRVLPDGTEVDATDHQLHFLLRSQPNADMNAVDFWTAFVSSLLLWGNACVEKRMAGGVITSLIFLQPEFVDRQQQTDGSVKWRYRDPISGKSRDIPEDRMWHTKAFSLDGRWGLSPIRCGSNVIGAAMAADKASAATFKNGMRSPGVVTMAGTVKAAQRDEIRKHVRETNAAGDVMVLEGANGFTQLRMNPQDAELLSTRAFNVEEICRWFNVVPALVGHSSSGQTMWGTGLEQLIIGFVTFSLRRWAVRIEQSARVGLLQPGERGSVTIKYVLEGLLRGDSASRAAFYAQMVQNGAMTRDEVRAKENLPLMGGNAGVLTVQSNLLPIDLLGQSDDSTAARSALKGWLGLPDPEPKNEP